jgi:hypothetical protein
MRNVNFPNMTVEGIKAAIEQLSEADRRKLADWFEEMEEQAWDKQIEQDFSPGGRGMPLVAELERELAEGKTRPMEEGFAARRKSRL